MYTHAFAAREEGVARGGLSNASETESAAALACAAS